MFKGMTIGAGAVLIALAMLVLTIAPAAAKPIMVNSNLDINLNDGNCTLREAIASAINGIPSGAIAGECSAGKGKVVKIFFDDTFLPAVITLVGQIPIPVSIDIRGPGPAQLTIVAATNFRHFFVTDMGALFLSGVRLTGGSITGSGGAIVVSVDRRLDLSWRVVDNNTATGNGGAIFLSNNATTTIDHCTFFANDAGGTGGAIMNSRGTLTVSHSNFYENTGAFGGAIYNHALSSNSAQLTVYHSTFRGNFADTENGGAIATQSTEASVATTTITDSTIVANEAASDGGGVNNNAVSPATATTTITDSVVAGNTAPGVDDINNEGTGTANLTVTNTVFDVCVTLAGACP